MTGYLVVHLRRERNQVTGRDEFLTLGLIALAYGLALLFHTVRRRMGRLLFEC